MSKQHSQLFKNVLEVPEDIIDAVDYYVEQCGLFIVPCNVMESKRPMAKWKRGSKMLPASEMKTKVKRGGGIGFPVPRGAIVVDLDIGDKINGVDSFLDIVFSHDLNDSPLDTLTVITPSGGSHLYYRGDLSTTNAGQIGPGIDLRGGGTGLVVLPPSYGKAFKGRYEFDTTVSQRERKVPSWLARDIIESHRNLDAHVNVDLHELPNITEKTSKWGKVFLRKKCAAIAQAQQGTRNNTLNRCAYGISRAVSGGEIAYEDAVVAIEAAAALTGLSQKEINATIQSAIHAGVRVPFTSPRQDNNNQKVKNE